MADIKTRDVLKGTVKTIDKAATAAERMKSAYAKTKDKAEHGYYAEENSPNEYATVRVSGSMERTAKQGVHQFNKQGQKSVKETKENIIKGKDKIADFKEKRAAQAVKKKQSQGQQFSGSQGVSHRNQYTPRQPSAQTAKAAQQGNKNIKQAHGAKGTIKTAKSSVKFVVKTPAKSTVKATSKGVKTARRTSKTAIKTTQQTAKAAHTTAKTTTKAVQKSAQAARTVAKATANAIKVSIKATISAVRAIIAATKALITAIIAGGWIAILIILIVVLFGALVSLVGGNNSNSSYTPVSAEVEAYEPLIRTYATQHGIPEYVELIKAVMMQESGGRGNDPMQASECGFNTQYSNSPNGITDPEYSINVGIQNLAACLKAAGTTSPIDLDNIKTALQGYNYGNGYISWALSNYGGYTYANAVEFSTMQAQRLGWDAYGDTQYVSHVLRYYPFGRTTGVGRQAIVEVAAAQLGNQGGQPYWSWYGFNSRVEWCACFVSWCADQCGYIDSGTIPKFSLCTDGIAWFQKQGQWQDGSYTPSAGHIIFFDWDGDGSSDHVGIVEKCENGIIYTIEGNSNDACKQRSYTVGSSSICGYGIPLY